jgi:hypothetical protein
MRLNGVGLAGAEVEEVDVVVDVWGGAVTVTVTVTWWHSGGGEQWWRGEAMARVRNGTSARRILEWCIVISNGSRALNVITDINKITWAWKSLKEIESECWLATDENLKNASVVGHHEDRESRGLYTPPPQSLEVSNSSPLR